MALKNRRTQWKINFQILLNIYYKESQVRSGFFRFWPFLKCFFYRYFFSLIPVLSLA